MAATELSPPGSFRVTGSSPIDVSAHIKLLGESLNNIGQKLKEHEVGELGGRVAGEAGGGDRDAKMLGESLNNIG